MCTLQPDTPRHAVRVLVAEVRDLATDEDVANALEEVIFARVVEAFGKNNIAPELQSRIQYRTIFYPFDNATLDQLTNRSLCELQETAWLNRRQVLVWTQALVEHLRTGYSLTDGARRNALRDGELRRLLQTKMQDEHLFRRATLVILYRTRQGRLAAVGLLMLSRPDRWKLRAPAAPPAPPKAELLPSLRVLLVAADADLIGIFESNAHLSKLTVEALQCAPPAELQRLLQAVPATHRNRLQQHLADMRRANATEKRIQYAIVGTLCVLCSV